MGFNLGVGLYLIGGKCNYGVGYGGVVVIFSVRICMGCGYVLWFFFIMELIVCDYLGVWLELGVGFDGKVSNFSVRFLVGFSLCLFCGLFKFCVRFGGVIRIKV